MSKTRSLLHTSIHSTVSRFLGVGLNYAVILILTKHWFASKWCFAEFAQARALGKAIFAIVESPAGEQFVSNDSQHLDLTSNREGGLERLARRLREVALDAQGGFDWQKGRAPYPVTAAQMIDAVAAMEAINRSIESGVPVTV